MPYELLVQIKDIVEKKRTQRAFKSGNFICIFICQCFLLVQPMMSIANEKLFVQSVIPY
jgi:Na+-translocating ferredoxin:NAD+ oxidoreductase RnfA subunit